MRRIRDDEGARVSEGNLVRRMAVLSVEVRGKCVINECGTAGPTVNGVNVECMVRMTELGEE